MNIPNHNPAKVIIGVRVPAPIRDAMSKEYKNITDNIVRLIEQDLQSQTLPKIEGCNIMSCFIRQSDSYTAYVFGKHKRTKERLYKGFHGFNTRTEAINAAMNYIKNPE